MYYVAICDDEEILCTQFERILEPYILEKKISVDVFCSGEEFMKALHEGEHFDLIFLDIELSMMNGVEVGKAIREKLHDEKMQIVYISAKRQYAMELFETRPLNFLVKPIADEKIIEVLEKAMRLNHILKNCFEVKTGAEIRRIPYEDIQYFESSNRKILIHTDKETFEMYGKLNTVEEELPSIFVRIHQSYIVNTKQIKRWRPNEVYLTDEIEALPISQKYRKDIRRFLLGEKR